MKKRIALILLVILILVIFLYNAMPAPEPEHCSLCGYIPSHAPCLINLSTGEVGELRVYETHPFKVGEISSVQRGGYFCFLSAAGLRGYLDTANWETHFTIPKEQDQYEEKYFCKACRELLQECAHTGFALADLRNPEEPVIYQIVDHVLFSVRCYDVSISKTEAGDLEIVVKGTL